MVTVERALLHALAFDFNVELPLPLAWRFLDAILDLAPDAGTVASDAVAGRSSQAVKTPQAIKLYQFTTSYLKISFETTLCLQLRSCEIVYGCIKLAMATLKWASDVADQRVCEAVQKHFPGQQLQLTAATASLVQAAVVNILKANHPAAVAAAATPTVAAVFQPGGGSGEAGASSARHLPLVPGSVSNPAPSASAHWSAAAAAISCAASSGGAGDACSSGEHGASEASVCTHAPLPAPPCHREDWVEGAEYEVHGRSCLYSHQVLPRLC